MLFLNHSEDQQIDLDEDLPTSKSLASCRHGAHGFQAPATGAMVWRDL